MKRKMARTALAATLAATSVLGQQVGQPVPDVRAPSTAGKELGPADFKGQWLVIFFYPRALTPGCTKQSCSMRDGYEALAKEQVAILGVSLDSLEKQKQFKEKYQLPYELLSDADKNVSKAFGVLGPMGAYAQRRTFIISPDGTIAAVIEKVDVSDHATQVLDALRALRNSPQW